MPKKLFSTYLEETTIKEFLHKYKAPENGSMSSRLARAIKNSLKAPLEETSPEPMQAASGNSPELPVLSAFRELHEYRKEIGLSKAGNLNDFLYHF